MRTVVPLLLIVMSSALIASVPAAVADTRVILDPDQDVLPQEWAHVGCDPPQSHFHCVDDGPGHDGDTTHIVAVGGTLEENFELADGTVPSDARIEEVTIHAVVRRVAGAGLDPDVDLLLADPQSTDTCGSRLTISSVVYFEVGIPCTSIFFTPQEIPAIRFRAIFVSPVGHAAARITSAWAEIVWSEGEVDVVVPPPPTPVINIGCQNVAWPRQTLQCAAVERLQPDRIEYRIWSVNGKQVQSSKTREGANLTWSVPEPKWWFPASVPYRIEYRITLIGGGSVDADPIDVKSDTIFLLPLSGLLLLLVVVGRLAKVRKVRDHPAPPPRRRSRKEGEPIGADRD